MNCPRCNSPVKDNQVVCKKCGKRLRKTAINDGDIVYFEGDLKEGKTKRRKKLLLTVLAFLLTACAVAGSVWFVNYRNRKSASNAAAPTTTAAATEAAEKSTAAAKETKAGGASADASPEEKLLAYADKADLTDTLKAAADDKTNVAVTAEHSVLYARYRVDADMENHDNDDYFKKLTDSFEKLAASLDKTVYEMKKSTGVDDARLEIQVTDNKKKSVFSKVID